MILGERMSINSMGDATVPGRICEQQQKQSSSFDSGLEGSFVRCLSVASTRATNKLEVPVDCFLATATNPWLLPTRISPLQSSDEAISTGT
jgi:hypothetical protein